jgi:tetratricopeptide (TPR) repeat protein
VAFAVRAIHIWSIRDSPFFDVLLGDARRYDAWAAGIAAGNWAGTGVFYQAPLYPYLLGTFYALAGRNLMTVRLVQAAIGATACVLLAFAARRVHSERAGVIAGLGLACYAPAIFFDSLLQKSTLDVFFVSLSIWIVSALLDSPSRRGLWAALGLVVGGFSLTRENALVLAFPLIVWALWRRSLPARDRLQHALAFAVGIAIVLMPVAIRNRTVGGEWHLTTSQFGPNLYIGNNAESNGAYTPLLEGRGLPEYEREDATTLAEAAAGRHLTPGEVSAFWVDQTRQFIASQPADWLGLMGRKVVLLWNTTEWVDTESQHSYAEWSPLLDAAGRVGHFGVLIPLAVLGVFITWRDRRRFRVLYAMTAAYASSVVVFYVSARYRLPLVPFLMLFAAAGIADAVSFVRTASQMRAGAALAATAVVAVVTNRPVLSADLTRAITENNLGTALQADSRLEDAEAHYRRAVALEPAYWPAQVNLGSVLFSRNRAGDAVQAFARAGDLGAQDPNLDVKLANALLKAGRPGEAVDHFRRAIAAGRQSAEIYNNLGVALVAVQRKDEAIAAYEASLQLSPANARLHFTLGTLWLERARFDAAVREFRAGLALQEDSAEAHNNLGTALMASGRSAEAVAEFEAALRINPDLVSAQRNLEQARVSGRVRRRTIDRAPPSSF